MCIIRSFVSTLLLSCVTSPTLVAGDELKELVALVQRHEASYQSLGLVISSTYRKLPHRVSDTEHTETQTSTAVILSGNRFRVEQTTASKSRTKAYRSSSIRTSDGEQHYQFSQTSITHNQTGRVEDQPSTLVTLEAAPVLSNLARPHMLLLEDGAPQVPLSVYLQGQEAIAQYPNPGYFPRGASIQVTDKGVGQVQGMNCRRILIDTVINGAPHNGWELWLAKERNMIPARIIAYTYRWSAILPTADKYVYAWEQLAEDTWIPAKVQITRYDSQELKLGKKVISWRKHYSIEDPTLAPTIASDTFTIAEREIPNG